MSELMKEKFCKPTYERAILSYCFGSINNYYVIAPSISDRDFLRPEHKMLWMIFGTLIKRGAAKFDGALIINEAKQEGILKNIGGYEYVSGIMGMEVSESNIRFYLDKVLDASTKYQLFVNLNADLKKLCDEAENEGITAGEVLGEVTTGVLDLSIKSKAIKEAKNLADGILEYIEERRSNPVEYCGLSTGYPILDKRVDGLVPGTLTVFCARPKNGKSTFLSNISAHVAYRLKKPILYVDTEMPFEQWRPRILSMLSGVREVKIKHGNYSDHEYYNLQQAAKLIDGGKLFHEYMPGYTIDKLIALYKKYRHVENIGLAVFDYIKAPPGADFKERKEHQILGDVTTALKDIAGELQIPVLCANQINRQGDIADSDRILRYADVLMFFTKKKHEDIVNDGIASGTYRLVIRHSRRGGETPDEGIGYDFYKSTLQISEAEIQQIDYSKKEYAEDSEDMEYKRKPLSELMADDADSGSGETSESNF